MALEELPEYPDKHSKCHILQILELKLHSVMYSAFGNLKKSYWKSVVASKHYTEPALLAHQNSRPPCPHLKVTAYAVPRTFIYWTPVVHNAWFFVLTDIELGEDYFGAMTAFVSRSRALLRIFCSSLVLFNLRPSHGNTVVLLLLIFRAARCVWVFISRFFLRSNDRIWFAAARPAIPVCFKESLCTSLSLIFTHSLTFLLLSLTLTSR